MVENMDVLGYNYLRDCWGWVRLYGALDLGGFLIAENLGMMSNYNE
jgi:hypothetical protein